MYHKKTKVKEVLETQGIVEVVEERIGKKIPKGLLVMGKTMTLEKVGKLCKLTEAEIEEAIVEMNEVAKRLKEEKKGTVGTL